MVFFVNSGFVKSFLKAAGFIELDITILSMMLLGVFSFLLLKNYRLKVDHLSVIVLFILFLVFYLSSFLYTTSESYYVKKLMALTGLFFSFLFGLLSTKKVRFNFYRYYSVFSVIAVSIYFVLILSNLNAEVLKDFTGNSLVAGEMLGASVLIFYFSKSRFRYAFIIFSFLIMIALGARGPLLFSLLVLILVSLRDVHKVCFKTPIYLAVVVFSIMIVATANKDSELSLIASKTFTDGLSRFELLFESDKGESVNARTTMLNKTLAHIDENIFLGTGVGSFGIEVYGRDFRAYPHNVPLEIWFESGVFAFVFFHLFIILLLFHLFKIKNYLLVSLLIYLYLNMNKSSSLEELRLFFLLAGISVASSHKKVDNY